jgi:hypothetical protein
MRHSYAKEKMGVAVRALATSQKNIRERIWTAYLSFHTLKEDDFPEELREDWNFIETHLTREEPTKDERGEVTIGRVQNSLAKMNGELCEEIAEKICDLNSQLRRSH